MSQEIKKVIEQIKAQKTKMHSKRYFLLRSGLKIGLLVIFILTAIYLFSFTLYYLTINGSIHLSEFGLDGIRDLLLSLPWVIIIIALLSIIGLIWLSDKYPITYRNPLIYTLSVILVVVFAGGYVVAKTSFHPALLNLMEHRVPGGRLIPPHLINPEQAPFRHGLFGAILEINNNSFTIQTNQNEEIIVLITPQTKTRSRKDPRVGDKIIVRGEIEDGLVKAIDYRIIPKKPHR